MTIPLVSNKYHNYAIFVKNLKEIVEIIPAKAPINNGPNKVVYISAQLAIIIAPESDAFKTWSNHNFPYVNIFDNIKVQIVLEVNHQNVFIIAKNFKFHENVFKLFIELKNGNKHHKKNVPIKDKVEVV